MTRPLRRRLLVAAAEEGVRVPLEFQVDVHSLSAAPTTIPFIICFKLAAS